MPHHPAAPHRRLTAAATAGGTLAAMLIPLAGMPYVLWRAAGIPWPEHAHSWNDLGARLAEPVTEPLLTDLLAMVGWVCWAAFAYTVVRELCWYTAHLPQLLRDRRAHDEHLAAVSFRNSLAALCIGTLVIALLSLWRPQPADAHQPSSAPDGVRPRTAATAPLVPAPHSPAAAAPAPTRPAPQHPAANEKAGHIEYTVVAGDTLWDIAHTHLGDACKWPRIYAANKDRIQRDGARLGDPDQITPGWQLTIPVTRATTPPPPPPTQETTPAPPSAPPTEAAPAQPTPHQDTGTDHQGEDSATQPTDAEAKPGPAAIGLGQASLIGITAAVGLLAARRYWYWHQNRLHQPGTQTPTLSPLVDKAAQAAHAATLHRRPQDPDALITHRTPPQPPRSTGTVTIGVRDDAEVSLDELAVPGGCTWTGPGAEGAARALLVGVFTAAERQRPRTSPHVTAVVPQDLAEHLLPGLPPQFTALTQSTDTAHAIRAAEQHLIAHARTQDEHGTYPATTDSPEPAGPGTLLLLTAPDASHTGQLQALAARNSPDTLIVLTLSTPLPGTQIWHIAADGTTSHPGPHGPHPGQLRLFHLTPEAGRDVTEVLLTAHGQRPRLRILPAPAGPPPDEEPPEPASPEPSADTAPAHLSVIDVPARPTQTKAVRLHVLGPITLYARDHQDPIGTNLRPEVHEFLTLLAAHPAGLLASDIADKLRLAPGTDQNALKNLRRAVRRVLRAATGITAQEFVLLQGELHKLHPDLVETDLADFTRSLKQAFATTPEEANGNALPAVRDALAHYRGPFAQGRDYLWADAIREHLATQATDAALRLARTAEHTDTAPAEREAVLMMLEHLSTIHPDHERLAQHTIRLYQTAGRHDVARHIYNRLKRHLDDLGLEPEPATQALIAPRTRTRHAR